MGHRTREFLRSQYSILNPDGRSDPFRQLTTKEAIAYLETNMKFRFDLKFNCYNPNDQIIFDPKHKLAVACCLSFVTLFLQRFQALSHLKVEDLVEYVRPVDCSKRNEKLEEFQRYKSLFEEQCVDSSESTFVVIDCKDFVESSDTEICDFLQGCTVGHPEYLTRGFAGGLLVCKVLLGCKNYHSNKLQEDPEHWKCLDEHQILPIGVVKFNKNLFSEVISGHLKDLKASQDLSTFQPAPTGSTIGFNNWNPVSAFSNLWSNRHGPSQPLQNTGSTLQQNIRQPIQYPVLRFNPIGPLPNPVQPTQNTRIAFNPIPPIQNPSQPIQSPLQPIQGTGIHQALNASINSLPHVPFVLSANAAGNSYQAPSALAPPAYSQQAAGPSEPGPSRSMEAQAPMLYHLVRKPSDFTEAEVKENCGICTFQLKEGGMYDDDDNQSHRLGELIDCKHVFHLKCLQRLRGSKTFIQCPICQHVYGVKIGTQPDCVQMFVTTSSARLPGFNCSTIEITYTASNGIQGSNHPNPGSTFQAPGFPRKAYLPNNEKGLKVQRLLQRAFQQKLIFTIGTSTTTGRNNVITWNDIHHKTSNHPGAFGYPDPNYLDNVLEELAVNGIKE